MCAAGGADAVRKIREWIWRRARSRVPLGFMLPWWLRVVRYALFPIETAQLLLLDKIAPVKFDWALHCYVIHGARFSPEALRYLALSNGETYTIRRDGDFVYLERLPDA